MSNETKRYVAPVDSLLHDSMLTPIYSNRNAKKFYSTADVHRDVQLDRSTEGLLMVLVQFLYNSCIFIGSKDGTF
jgi:hypothetical protein